MELSQFASQLKDTEFNIEGAFEPGDFDAFLNAFAPEPSPVEVTIHLGKPTKRQRKSLAVLKRIARRHGLAEPFRPDVIKLTCTEIEYRTEGDCTHIDLTGFRR